MPYDIVEARHIAGCTVWIRFRDGSEGEVDLTPALVGPQLAPLLDPARCRQVRVHPEFHTLVWPDGADLAPELLYQMVTSPAQA